MDPLSAVASVIAVIQLTQVVSRVLKGYFSTAREARKDIDSLFSSITSLELILVEVSQIANNQHSEDLAASLEHPGGPLQLLKAELEILRVILKAPRAPQSKGSLGTLVQSLQWPFKKGEVEKFLSAIERHKSTLNANLGFGMLDLQIKDLDILTSIQADIKNAQSDREHQAIIRWLSNSIPDPSQEHNAAIEKHVEGTGAWLILSQEVKTWAATGNSFIWFNGGSGSGKTILCSTLIESLKTRCRFRRQSVTAVVYWYFSFANKQTQNLSNFLRSIVRDLCSKVLIISKVVHDLWSDLNNGQQLPSKGKLLEMIRVLAKSFDSVYLVIDGVDEFPRSNRRELLDAIQRLASDEFPSLHMFVASRPEGDLREAFEEISETSAYYSNVTARASHFKEDINKYLDARMQSRSCNKWQAEEKSKITSSLATQADGMFRLVALQMDKLNTLLSRSKRREAMTTLPKSLNHCYDRLMEDIDESNHGIAQKALTWLLFSARPLTLAELAEAIMVKSTEPYFVAAERFDDENCILTIIPAGFVRLVFDDRSRSWDYMHSKELVETTRRGDANGKSFQSSPTVQLAHQSVKDYLLSSRVSGQRFIMEHTSARNLMRE
ncbi:hypothetical protein BKA61DRAFT_529805, partial [Leptodontidium sp. MPI-SDFR-AT-0119]